MYLNYSITKNFRKTDAPEDNKVLEFPKKSKTNFVQHQNTDSGIYDGLIIDHV